MQVAHGGIKFAILAGKKFPFLASPAIQGGDQMIMRVMMTVGGLYAAIVLSGCSILMALNGNKEPNFEYIKAGATKEEIDFEFDQAGTSKEIEDGKTEVTYKYEKGNSPNPARAAVYGYIDLYTLGIAEPILTIIELVQGDDVETHVVYGPDKRALEVHGYTPPPPSAELKAAQEEQEKYVRKRPAPRSDHPESTFPVSLESGESGTGTR